MDTLQETIKKVVTFRDERDWAQFHTPRNLAAGLAIEAGELQQALLWKSDEEVKAFVNDPSGRKVLSEEIGDILIFALLFCHATDVDPVQAIEEKLRINSSKYPVELVKGRATKYTELKPKGQSL